MNERTTKQRGDRRVYVPRVDFDALLNAGALRCSKCGKDMVQHGKPCVSSHVVLTSRTDAFCRPASPLSQVLQSHGYALLVREELSGVKTSLYVHAASVRHRAQVFDDEQKASVLFGNRYRTFTDPAELDRALRAVEFEAK